MWALALMSLGPICLYAIIWLGWIKSWYILLPLPGKFNSSAVYALLPWGLAFTALWLSVILPTTEPTEMNIWLHLFLVLDGVGLLFIIWCPQWLKPPWVQWLEREYGYGLPILLEEARAMGRWQWEARVRTREGLERWAREVREKRERDMYQAWKDWMDCYVDLKLYKMRRKGKKKPKTVESIVPYVPKHRESDYQEWLRDRSVWW